MADLKLGYSNKDENVNTSKNNLLLTLQKNKPHKLNISKSVSTHYNTKDNSNSPTSIERLHTYSIRDNTPPHMSNLAKSAPPYEQSSRKKKNNHSLSPNRKVTHHTVIAPLHSSNIHEPHYYRSATSNNRNSNRSHPMNKKTRSVRNTGKKRMKKKSKTPTLIPPSLSPSNIKNNQFVGDIVMHNSSWEALIQQKEQSSAIHGWRNVFAVLEQQSLRFWEVQ